MHSRELKERFFEVFDEVGSTTVAARKVGVNLHTAAGWVRKAGRRSAAAGGHGPHPRRGEYEQLRRAGVPRRRAAERVGVNERTARDWDYGVRKTHNSRTYPDGRRVDYNTGVTTILDTTPRPASPAIAASASGTATIGPSSAGSSHTMSSGSSCLPTGRRRGVRDPAAVGGPFVREVVGGPAVGGERGRVPPRLPHPGGDLLPLVGVGGQRRQGAPPEQGAQLRAAETSRGTGTARCRITGSGTTGGMCSSMASQPQFS